MDMFASATSFNGDVSRWDVRKVTSTEGMFKNAANFNQDLSDWSFGQDYQNIGSM